MRHLGAIATLAAAFATNAVLLSSAHAGAPADPAVVSTDSGPVRGTVAVDHRTFSGIPYAAPPVGDRRWRAPSPPPSWTSVRDTTRPGNRCPQLGGSNGSQLIGSEDCLYANVTTPARRASAHLPVMVWVPGGGFVLGAGSDYDPARLAVQGHVVVVTVNYRLGALGFLDHPALAATDRAAGDFGIADQQAALRWVRRNIDGFGGDAHNVTLFGQSAGAFSVCAQLASPGSAGLFHKAIVESGPCANSMVTRSVAQARGTRSAGDLGCRRPATVAACLRAVPVSRLVGIGSDQVFTPTDRLADMPWGPVAGTPSLPRQPLQAMRTGLAARVPLLLGTTHDEMRPFVAINYDARHQPVTAAEYPRILAQAFGADAPAVRSRYPLDAYPSPGIALATALTDWGRKLGACPALSADRIASRWAPVHAYEFAEDNGQRIGDFPMGAAHGAELPYLFDGSYTGPSTPPLSPTQQTLSQQMIAYWSHFATNGNPNGTGLPPWPTYRNNQTVLTLTATHITPTDFNRAHQCAFWNADHEAQAS